MITDRKTKLTFFSREKLIPHLSLLLVLIIAIIVAFLSGIFLLKVLAYIAISVIGTMAVTYLLVNVLLERYPTIVYIINELLYLLVGLPALGVAGLFVPISIYVFFFKPNNKILVYSIIALAVLVEIASIVYVIKAKLRERNTTLGAYIKDFFNFKKRIEEMKRIEERKAEIDSFYARLKNVERIKEQRLKEKTSNALENFDWKQRLKELSQETIEGIPCYNCGHLNPNGSEVCAKCGATLSLQKPHSPISQRKIFSIRYYSSTDPEYKTFKQYLSIIIFGVILFIIGGVLNIADETVKHWSFNAPLLPYFFAGIISASFIPIGLGIKWMTEDYFESRVAKLGREINFLLITYAGSFFISALVLGNVIVASFTTILIVVSRVVAFNKIDKMLRRLSKFWKISLGGVLYVIYAYYQVIVSLFMWLANVADDDNFRALMFAFNGVIESLLTIIIGIKLLVDFLKINNYVITHQIRPRNIDKSIIIRDLIEKRKQGEKTA